MDAIAAERRVPHRSLPLVMVGTTGEFTMRTGGRAGGATYARSVEHGIEPAELSLAMST
ncbi:MAG: hypothetical protein AB1440_11920 [Pseudomonadota bacterium]|jgi:hypothetical protein